MVRVEKKAGLGFQKFLWIGFKVKKNQDFG